MPAARGPVSLAVRKILLGESTALEIDVAAVALSTDSTLDDEDLQLGLLMLYELHYRGLQGVSDDWEWNLELLALREQLERRFEQDLRALAETVPVPAAEDLAETLFAMTAPSSGPSLSKFLAASATVEQYREFLTVRSVYHLKEADPHTWAIPRLSIRPKAALVEVQVDEYGGGRAVRMHASLFARSMRALGLDDGYGVLVDRVPGYILATTNAMSLFGLHRRLLGAIVGHLAVFEMTSSLPNKRYGNGLRRLGFDREATLFFDEHVEADAVHEQIAGRDLAGALAAEQPAVEADILFGARACLALDDLVADRLLPLWRDSRSALRVAA